MHNFGVTVADEYLDFIVEGQVSNPLKEYIERLSEEHDPIFNRFDMMGGGKYVLELAKIAQQIKLQQLQNLVIEEFGTVARRVWGVLVKSQNKYDDKQVSKLALVDEKTTREQLYKLFKFGLVFMQVFSYNHRMYPETKITVHQKRSFCGMSTLKNHVN